MSSKMMPHIRVVGVGSYGCYAVSEKAKAGIPGTNNIRFIAADSDKEVLGQIAADAKIIIEEKLINSLSMKIDIEACREMPDESIDGLEEALSGADVVIIVAGMGGKTGTLAAPLIARRSKEKDILTLGVITEPFRHEGETSASRAGFGQY